MLSPYASDDVLSSRALTLGKEDRVESCGPHCKHEIVLAGFEDWRGGIEAPFLLADLRQRGMSAQSVGQLKVGAMDGADGCCSFRQRFELSKRVILQL